MSRAGGRTSIPVPAHRAGDCAVITERSQAGSTRHQQTPSTTTNQQAPKQTKACYNNSKQSTNLFTLVDLQFVRFGVSCTQSPQFVSDAYKLKIILKL